MNAKLSPFFQEHSGRFSEESFQARISRLPEACQKQIQTLGKSHSEQYETLSRELTEQRPRAIEMATMRELQKLTAPNLNWNQQNGSPSSRKAHAKMRAIESVGNNHQLRLMRLQQKQQNERRGLIENAEKNLSKTKSLKRAFNPPRTITKTFNKGIQR